MKKIVFVVEYNGAHFCGWQKQNGKRTVQEEIEKAIFELTVQKCEVEGSGRTDRGVHALGQVAMVVLDLKMPLKNFKLALNNLLPKDIRIKKVYLGRETFHPRFSAKRKTYRYITTNKETAIGNELITFYPYNVDVENIKNNAQLLIGKHNFKAFCSSKATVTNFEREIYEIKITKKGAMLIFDITGNGFLYNMVRIIVGSLLQISDGNILKKALESGDRSLLGTTMPPNGLYLKSVKYDK